MKEIFYHTCSIPTITCNNHVEIDMNGHRCDKTFAYVSNNFWACLFSIFHSDSNVFRISKRCKSEVVSYLMEIFAFSGFFCNQLIIWNSELIAYLLKRSIRLLSKITSHLLVQSLSHLNMKTDDLFHSELLAEKWSFWINKNCKIDKHFYYISNFINKNQLSYLWHSSRIYNLLWVIDWIHNDTYCPVCTRTNNCFRI